MLNDLRSMRQNDTLKHDAMLWIEDRITQLGPFLRLVEGEDAEFAIHNPFNVIVVSDTSYF